MINPQVCPYKGECDIRAGRDCKGLSDTFFRDGICHFRKISGLSYLEYAKKMVARNADPEMIADITGIKPYMVYDIQAEMEKNGKSRQRSASKA
jgi:hypothetical protein